MVVVPRRNAPFQIIGSDYSVCFLQRVLVCSLMNALNTIMLPKIPNFPEIQWTDEGSWQQKHTVPCVICCTCRGGNLFVWACHVSFLKAFQRGFPTLRPVLLVGEGGWAWGCKPFGLCVDSPWTAEKKLCQPQDTTDFSENRPDMFGDTERGHTCFSMHDFEGQMRADCSQMVNN